MALQNQAAISSFFKSKGLNAVAIAAIMGNIEVESEGNPTAYNSGEGAIGIAQWEGGRRTKLQAYAASQGTSETDLMTQLNFYWQELTGPYRSVLDALSNATDVTAAATTVQAHYEGSTVASLPNRVADAQTILAGGVQGGTGVNDTSSSGGAQISDSIFGIPGTPSFGSIGGDITGLFGSAFGAAGNIVGGVNDVAKAMGVIATLFSKLLWIFNIDHFIKFELFIWGFSAVMAGLLFLVFAAKDS